jgi:hypothetical protein
VLIVVTDSKDWYKSKTLWGVLFSAGGKIAAITGYGAEAEAALTLGSLVVSFAGDAWAAYGRFKVTQPVR